LTTRFDDPGKDVFSVSVPAGNYWMSMNLNVIFQDGDAQTFDCSLSTGQHVAKRRGDGVDFVTLQEVVTFLAPATITVHCTGFAVSLENQAPGATVGTLIVAKVGAFH
jgi:hypothetical protein